MTTSTTLLQNVWSLALPKRVHHRLLIVRAATNQDVLPRLCRSFSSSSSSSFTSTATVQQLQTQSPAPAAAAEPVPKSPIYVAATRQHVGKTTTSLAIMSGLQKRFDKVGFIKPVGQVCLTVQDEEGFSIEVDKDVVVVRNHFKLDHCKYSDMSPVRIPPGYTKDYIDGFISRSSQRTDILDAFHSIDCSSDVVLCEGTGHCGVGSIVGASNAQVASWVGGKMVRLSRTLLFVYIVYSCFCVFSTIFGYDLFCAY